MAGTSYNGMARVIAIGNYITTIQAKDGNLYSFIGNNFSIGEVIQVFITNDRLVTIE